MNLRFIDKKIESLTEYIHQLRVIKSAAEQKIMNTAGEISGAAFTQVRLCHG